MPSKNPLLSVPYYKQWDSQSGHAMRMCFSSSCAMLLQSLKPGTLKGVNGDDSYLQEVLHFGDTTSSTAQTQALNQHFHLSAQFRKDLTWADIDSQLDKGVPVPIGILHHGPVSNPTGGGHWIIIIGRDGSDYIVHDPFGDLDLVNGGYPAGPGNGQKLRYSKKNLDPRWRVKGTGGWGIVAKK